MIFSKIFKFFILFFLIFAYMTAANGSIYTVSSKCEVKFTPTSELFAPLMMNYASELNKHLQKIFPERLNKSIAASKKKFRIIISDEQKNSMKTVTKGNYTEITISGISPDFQNDYNFLHNFFTAVAVQYMPEKEKIIDAPPKLPHWIFLALHAKIKNSFTGFRIIRNQRTISGMKFFLYENIFPDPLLLESCNGSLMSNTELFLFQDYCRFLLELSLKYSPADDIAVATYLHEIYAENATSDPALFQRLIIKPLQKNAVLHLQRIYDAPEKYDEKQQMDIFLKFNAERLAFSLTDPANVNFLKQRFNEFKKVRFIELDEENKPTGNVIESSIEHLPELIGKYPVCAKVLQIKQGELFFFRSIAGAFFTAELNELIDLLSDVKDSWLFGTSKKDILESVAKVDLQLEKFAEVQNYLEQTELKNLSPFQIFPRQFFISNELRNNTVPKDFITILDKVEKEYLD